MDIDCQTLKKQVFKRLHTLNEEIPKIQNIIKKNLIGKNCLVLEI